jgi:hypothetical protein
MRASVLTITLGLTQAASCASRGTQARGIMLGMTARRHILTRSP